jgi:selenocysteine-specific elongation factor
LTKSDLVDADILELVKLEVEEFVAGSFLESAELVPVSSPTGAGLEALRGALQRAAARAPERDPGGPMRLPIDRSFTVQGFGTVVTGTLISGSIAAEDEVALLPSDRPLRVRGLETYGKKTSRATAGTRTAVNLAGIEHTQIHRGLVLAEPGLFQAVREIDAELTMVPSAKALKNRAPVHFHSGTSETPAEVRRIDDKWARIRLARPMVLTPGDRFIIRQFSPVVTIGGGTVIDISPPRLRSIDRTIKRLEVLAGSDLSAKVSLIAQESAGPLTARQLGARLGIRPQEAVRAAPTATTQCIEPEPWIVSRGWSARKIAELAKVVLEYHSAAPLEVGISKADVRSKVLPDGPAPVFDALLAGCSEIAVAAEHVRHKKHRVTLNVQEDAARQAILAQFEGSGLAAPSVAEVLAQSGVDLARARTILQMLLKEGFLVRINESFILHSTAISKIREILSANRHSAFSVADFKGWTGVSRKYAVPLLEYCDRERLTLRRGDQRTIL